MSTWNGIGTKYLGYSHRNRDGSHYATEWGVLFDLPVMPLRRHRLKVGRTVHATAGTVNKSSTQFAVLEETPLNGREIARTYLTWWVLGPLVAVGPAALLVWPVSSKPDAGFGLWLFVLALSVAWVMGSATAMVTYSRRQHGLP